ncbi:hypothetical protein ACOMHN_011615 [Nucella lapillus]
MFLEEIAACHSDEEIAAYNSDEERWDTSGCRATGVIEGTSTTTTTTSMDRRATHLHHYYGSVSHTALTFPDDTPTPSSRGGGEGGRPLRGQGDGGEGGGSEPPPPQPPPPPLSGQQDHWSVSWANGDAHQGGAGHWREEGRKRGGSVQEWGRGVVGHSGQSWLSQVVPTLWGHVRLMRWALRNSLGNLLNMDRKKSTSLGALVLQTSVLALTIRYSRTEIVTGPRYLTSTAVVMSELLKVFVCLYMAFYSSARKGASTVWTDLTNVQEAVKTAVPAGLYTLQNNLQFIAVSHLDAATFQVTYQLKILSTAVFSVLFLHRHLDSLRWSALVLLTVGVAFVQLPDSSPGETRSGAGGSTLVGLMAVLVMCLSSGFAGVYFEKILKSSTQSIWAKNVQMGLAGVIMTDGSKVSENGFFQGYNTLTLIIVIQQALLGLIISMVMKYADNILKGFASAISIILTSIISCILLQDLHLSCSFLSGTSIVLISALLYNVDRAADKYVTHMV